MDAASDSAALLREFAESRSEAAFAALVSRHLGLVYATALRRGGRPALAEEACQLVFIDLARKAARVPSTMPLAGWLHRHACHVTAGLLRTEARRSRREELAMQHRHSAEDIDWSRLAAVLDEALLALPDADRAALVLRFLEQRPLAEVGAALCVTENAARMRVDRALDRLRDRLSRRGITSTASALAAVFAGPAVAGPPPALAATVTSAALAAGGAAASTFGLLSLMASTKLKAAAVAALILSAGTALVLEHRAARRQRDENAALLGRLAALSAEAEAARRAASAAQQARQARPGDELLAMRGEVARLRRELASRLPMSPPPQAVTVPMPEAEPDRAVTLTSVQALMPSGHTLVAGGWDWTEDRRGLLLITPTSEVGQNGQSTIELEYLTILLPDAVAQELGLAGQAEGEPDGQGPRVFDPEAALVLMRELEGREGVELLAVPRITTASGQAASVGLTSDATPFALNFEALPTVTADGLIDLRNVGLIKGVPPGGSTSPQP